MTEIYNVLGRVWNRRLSIAYILFTLLVFFGIDFFSNIMKGPLKYVIILAGIFSIYVIFKKNV